MSKDMSVLKLLSSRLRVDVLMSLSERAKRLSELRAELGIRDTTILHALTELESSSLVRQSGRNYELTPIGAVYALILEDVLGADDAIDRQKDFWLRHDISGIPESLLKGIGALRGARVIMSEPTDLAKVHETFLKLLSESRQVMGISPIFHIDYISVVRELVVKGANIKIIVTDKVLRNIIDSVGLDALTSTMKGGNLKLLLKDELKVAMTVTENILSLGLFTLDGSYDYSMDLVGEDKEAIGWGRALFDHYVKGAKDVDELSS
jgi:predicted transcriptional regulator